MKKYLPLIFASLVLFCSCANQKNVEPADDNLPLSQLSSGVYRAYPVPLGETTSPVAREEAGEVFYISTYNRHGSRYQPNDKRYANTLRRLQEAHDSGTLTPFGEQLLPQIQVLCDSCLGHGGLLTTVGVRQLAGIGQRMFVNYPEPFVQSQPGSNRPKHISARASVVKRCQQSMGAFFAGLFFQMNEAFFERFPGTAFNVTAECDSAYMAYISYDTPAMRQLASQDAFWQPDYKAYYNEHTMQQSVLKRIFTDDAKVDSLAFIDDLYWLCIGMQNVDVTGCDLSECFTPEELFECYRSVNYRMYICNSNAPMSQHVPAESASSLLQNIVESADIAIETDTVAATLRFGHDTNLLRLLALMRIQGSTAEVEDPAEAWKVWQEAQLCPMGANLQMIFRRHAKSHQEGGDGLQDVTVEFRLNEKNVLLDVEGLKPVNGSYLTEGGYYKWDEVRTFFLQQIKTDNNKTDFIEPVQ